MIKVLEGSKKKKTYYLKQMEYKKQYLVLSIGFQIVSVLTAKVKHLIIPGVNEHCSQKGTPWVVGQN